MMTNICLALTVAVLLKIEPNQKHPNRAGDGGRAVGPLQTWKISVDEANRLTGHRRWYYKDRSSLKESKAMARVVLAHHYRRGDMDPVSLACRWRNPYSQAPAWYRRKAERAYRQVLISSRKKHSPK